MNGAPRITVFRDWKPFCSHSTGLPEAWIALLNSMRNRMYSPAVYVRRVLLTVMPVITGLWVSTTRDFVLDRLLAVPGMGRVILAIV